MTIANINTVLHGQLPTITLSPATFGQDSGLTPILQQYFSETKGEIVIGGVTEANYHFDNDIITFSGIGQGGPFDKMTTSVVIKMVNAVPQISISATAADGWSLHPAFPTLNAPIIQQLPFSSPQLYWASYDSDTDETIKGFYFEGKLDMTSSPLNVLSALLPGLPAPDIWGQLDMVGSNTGTIMQFVPDGVLTIAASEQPAQLGPFTLTAPKLQIFANSVFNTHDNVWQADNFVRISSSLKFKSTWITFQADIKDIATDIVFDAKMDLPLGAALADLINFVGGTTLSIPGFNLQFPDDLFLQDIQVHFSPTGTPKIKMIALEVGTSPSEKWKLWSDSIFLNNIDIVFHILPGGTGTDTIVDGQFSGQVSEWLNLRAGFSTDGNYLFYGGLAKPVSIGQLYTFFSGNTNADLPALNVETLYFQLNLSKQQGTGYAGELTMDGEWDIVTQPTKFSLDGLLFKINQVAGGVVTIEAGGIMAISDYTLAVDGEYVTDQGWTLRGDLALQDEKKSLADLGAKIDSSFGSGQANAPSIPTFLTDWSVQSLHTDFNTKSKNFDFSIDVKNADLPALDLAFGIHLTHSDTAFTKEFDAIAKYISAKVNVEFDLTITEEDSVGPPASKKFTLLGVYKADVPPTLAELLETISQDFQLNANLPAELNLNAQVDSFALEIQQIDSNPTTVEAAGEFTLQIKNTTLNIYFAYTNNVASDAAFKNPIMVAGKPAYVFGASLGGIFALADLPVVGKIPGINRLAIDKLGFFYTNAVLAQGEQAYFQVPQVGDPGKLAPNPAQAVLAKNGFNLLAVFGTLGSSPTDPVTPLGSGNMTISVGTGTPPQQPPTFATSAAQPTSPIHWIDINKTFGPVSLNQVGLNYSSGEASIGISAGMTMGGFMLDLMQLSVTFPMPMPQQTAGSTVSFDLEGLAMSINKGGLQLGGAFLKAIDQDKSVSYYGEVMVQVANLGFKAIGGYSPNANPASFFIYVNIEIPLGGPPFLFITGLAGGFGINRALNLPTVDGLSTCLLVPGIAPLEQASPADTIKLVLPVLQQMCPPEPGEYWVAAGIQFTSFEMIQAFALVTVAFGVDLQIGLIGTCSMTFPTGDTEVAVAYVEIDIVASFTASTGLLAVDGRLSPASYILGGFVHLAGGFAFYIWFSGPHKGDFVVSLGGYHPAFNQPKYYPTVPRLSMSFALGPFQVIGQTYFALTPSMMMAGIGLAATWNSGPLKVWFDFGMDFLIGWAPFHYEADAYIHLGISLNLGLFTLSLHVGADLYVWGPQFGGVAHVDLDVVSFTISFGAPRSAPLPVGWSDFKTKFLPQSTTPAQTARAAMGLITDPPPATINIIKADVTLGLLKKDVTGYNWVVDPDHFNILTNSTIPSNNAAWNVIKPQKPADANIPNTVASYHQASAQPYLRLPADHFSDTLVWNPDVHIKPMGLDSIQSYHVITLYQRAETDPPGTFSLAVTAVSVQPTLLRINQALWGKPDAPDAKPNTDPNILPLAKDALTGFLIFPISRTPDQVSNVLLINLLFQSGFDANFAYTHQALNTQFTVNSKINSSQNLDISVSGASTQELDNQGYVLSTLTDTWVAGQRNAVLADLLNNGFLTYDAAEIDLTLLATKKALTDWPVVELMGS